MSKTARVPEPSMEEILASIRRIIADDSGAPAQQGSQAPASPQPAPQADAELQQSEVDTLLSAREGEPPGEADVLELTQAVGSGGAAFTPVRGPDVMFREEERQQAAPPPAVPAPASQAPAPGRETNVKEQDLLSPSSSATVAAAFNSLATTVLAENSRTLEDLVKEMMRPMLKQWLEENLPGLVERMVRTEIERVSRGGR